MQKILALVFLSILLVGCTPQTSGTGSTSSSSSTSTSSDGSVDPVQINQGDVDMEATYQGNSQWRYVLVTVLPNPCYGFRTEAVVAESYPEQVTVKAIKETPAAGTACAQVIDRRQIEGSFAAGPQAKLSLEVVVE
ncbi:MAG: hypothetical protein JNK26_03235 [Candidatus Doudnabacteria bacterium]|nr:hypothetical protein [Candidatus Doudnabacteria bacterium]